MLRLLEKARPSAHRTIDAGTQKSLTEGSLTSMIFLFQLVMGFAITNGAFIFVTGGGGSYIPRALSTYSVQEMLIFLTFLLTTVKVVQGLTMYLNYVYCPDQGGFHQHGLRPLCDFLLLFSQAAIYYYLSHTISQLQSNPFHFFKVLGVFFLVDVLWSLIAYIFDTVYSARSSHGLGQGETLLFSLALNLLAVGCGSVILSLHIHVLHIASAPTIWLLLMLLLVRNSVDFLWTYSDLYPGIFAQANGQE